MKPFRSKIITLSVCLLLSIAFTDKSHAQTDDNAHFEAGITDYSANNLPLAYKEFLVAAKETYG